MKGGGFSNRPKKWTAQAVTSGLRDFYRTWVESGGRIPPRSLETTNPPLIGGARRVFGSLKAAMEAAGLPYPIKPPTPWTKEAVIRELRRLHAQGSDLSLAAVNNRGSRGLLGPAVHQFGSWRNAIEAAGIDYASISRVIEWSPESVLQAIRKRHAEGKDIGGGTLQKEDVRLWAAGKRHFGNYENARAAAGFPGTPSAPEWSCPLSQLQKAIQDLHASGIDLSSGRIRHSHRDLFRAARERIGSWRRAVESAGLDYMSIRRAREWSPQEVIDRLREMHNAGIDLRPVVLQRQYIPISGAVQRYFGTLRKALAAAGLPYPEDRSKSLGHWTGDLVLQTLRDLNAQQHDLRHARMKLTHQPLFHAARKLFGTYAKAVTAAGIDYWQMSQEHLRREKEQRRLANLSDPIQ